MRLVQHEFRPFLTQPESQRHPPNYHCPVQAVRRHDAVLHTPILGTKLPVAGTHAALGGCPMQQCINPSRNRQSRSAYTVRPLHHIIHIADGGCSHAISIEKGDAEFAVASRVEAEINALVI